MKIFSFSHWAVAALLSVSAISQAAEFKVGFVNTDRVLRESKFATRAQERLEQEFSPREKALAKIAQDLQTQSKAFDRDAPTLAESERVKRQRELVQVDQDFQRKRREFQEDLAARKNEELQKVLARANGVIKDLAKKGNYDVIFQDVVYINPKHDMTPAVIAGLDSAP
jgi:outer membrane protein